MRVATARGYADGRIIEAGEEVPDWVPPGSWTGEAVAATEPGPLDLSVAKLTEHLETVTDLGDLEALMASEKAGKTRDGAVKAIQARIDALLA
jgi:hypothetical protein